MNDKQKDIESSDSEESIIGQSKKVSRSTNREKQPASKRKKTIHESSEDEIEHEDNKNELQQPAFETSTNEWLNETKKQVENMKPCSIHQDAERPVITLHEYKRIMDSSPMNNPRPLPLSI